MVARPAAMEVRAGGKGARRGAIRDSTRKRPCPGRALTAILDLPLVLVRLLPPPTTSPDRSEHGIFTWLLYATL